jgi:ferredoxin
MEARALGRLMRVLQDEGYEVHGPTLRDKAIVYDVVSDVGQLPQGWTEEQDSGTYRIKKREDDAYFGFTVGPHTWKSHFLPARRRLWRATQDNGTFVIQAEAPVSKPVALLGVRSCERKAIAIQDNVLTGGFFKDPFYQSQRESVFFVVVQCRESASTCFCASMDSGPRATSGFDLALTECIEESDHYFLVEVGSDRGQAVLEKLPVIEATPEERDDALAHSRELAGSMSRHVDVTDLPALLDEAFDDPHWQDVAERCMSCANCTMVCPTCFCTQVEDTTDLSGEHAERWRTWDSCFHLEHSYTVGGVVRGSTMSRYRQWLTHKLGTWVEQFGEMGCVGCGRCVTWCPVGIDLTKEVEAIRESHTTKSGGERS